MNPARLGQYTISQRSPPPVNANLMAEEASLVDLPPEIISEIFVHCLPWISSSQNELYPFEPQIAYDPCDAPLLLMRVCRRWRLIAEATPILWTRLPMTRPTMDLELYRMHIKNSGKAPLWAYVTSGNAGREIADILIPHSHRWEHLTLTFRARRDGPARVAITDLPTPLTSLKHLHLQQIYSSLREEADFNNLPTIVAPLLRSVRISSSKVIGFNLPWSQLTHYSGEFGHLQDAQAFLLLCTNLEVLHLHNPKQSFGTFNSMPSPIHLPRLRDLALINEQVQFNSYHPLIDCLDLPVLETACIGVDHGHSILKALCRCVVRSSHGAPRLRSVEIQCSQTRSLTRQNLQGLSLVAPGIQELRITRANPQALSAMRFFPMNPLFFPDLRHLTLVNPLLKNHRLVEIIISRCHPPSGLESWMTFGLHRAEVMFVEEPTPITFAMSRQRMIQPPHEEFQDVAESFTDDPNFRQMCDELKSITTVSSVSPGAREYQLPSHWDKSMDPLLRFLEFSDAVFRFFEDYEVHHPLLLSRHQAASRLHGFLRSGPGSDGLLRTHPQFLDRARALLERWQPIIDEYSKKNRWVVETVEIYSSVRRARVHAHKVVYRTFD